MTSIFRPLAPYPVTASRVAQQARRPASLSQATAPSPGPARATPAPAAPSAPAPTGKDLLFKMMPTGTARVMGFLTVAVQRAKDRIRIQAGDLADVVIQKNGSRYAYSENGGAPVEIQDVKTRRTVTGTHFDVLLASGKRVGMEISADRRSLTAMGYELHFQS